MQLLILSLKLEMQETLGRSPKQFCSSGALIVLTSSAAACFVHLFARPNSTGVVDDAVLCVG